MRGWTDDVEDREAFFYESEARTIALASDPGLLPEHLRQIDAWLEAAREERDGRFWIDERRRTSWGLALMLALLSNPNLSFRTVERWTRRELQRVASRGPHDGYRVVEALMSNPALPFWELTAAWRPESQASLITAVSTTCLTGFYTASEARTYRSRLRDLFVEVSEACPSVKSPDPRREVQRRMGLPPEDPLSDPNPREIFRLADSAISSATGASDFTPEGSARLVLVRLRVHRLLGYPAPIDEEAPTFWAWLLSLSGLEWPSLRPRSS